MSHATDFPDVSHWQGRVDWPGIRRAGATLAVVKVAQAGAVDSAFQRNWAESKAAGFKRSGYVFASVRTSPTAAADQLASLCHDAELPLVVDWEDASVPVTWVRDCLRRLDRRTGRLSLVYTTSAFARAHGGSILTPWPLWVARYRGESASDPGSVAPWASWMWWQFTDKGQLGPHRGDVNHVRAMPMVDDKAEDGVKPGDNPDKVRFLQVLLNFTGPDIPVSGKFDTTTGQAVRDFKHRHNAVSDAVRQAIGAPFKLSESEGQGWQVGPRTLQALAAWVRLVDSLGKADA